MDGIDFRAVTERGAVYERRDGNYYVKGRYWHNPFMKVVPQELFDQFHRDGKIDWEAVRALPEADVPVVGSSIYLSTLKEWKISSPVVELS